jgi:hypothetical protein
LIGLSERWRILARDFNLVNPSNKAGTVPATMRSNEIKELEMYIINQTDTLLAIASILFAI